MSEKVQTVCEMPDPLHDTSLHTVVASCPEGKKKLEVGVEWLRGRGRDGGYGRGGGGREVNRRRNG